MSRRLWSLLTGLLVVLGLAYAFRVLASPPPVKIVPPASPGMYLGSYEWTSGDISTFTTAVNKKPALAFYGNVMDNADGEAPSFNVAVATAAWNAGYIVNVQAYEASPNPDNVPGFTVDKLLNGEYDTQLSALAAQFRSFGHPMFFTTAREPNGIIAQYMGGFGPLGDKDMTWALVNQRGFDEFHPSSFPNPSLYVGLGSSTVSDGAERVAAAQRYYVDFFQRRENLNFLTFHTSGWTTSLPSRVDDELAELDPGINQTYARSLLESSYAFASAYPGASFVDWVSLNMYFLDYYAADWPGLEEDILVPNSTYVASLASLMAEVNTVAPSKPVLFLELGFPDGKNTNTAYAASKVTEGLTAMLSYPNIRGFAMWADSAAWTETGIFPYFCLIRPSTLEATAFRNVLTANPSKFFSCVRFSDGTIIPNCTP